MSMCTVYVFLSECETASFCSAQWCLHPANSITTPSRLPEADRARGRLSGYHPNGFLHGYKQPNYRPGPHKNTILTTQARTEHSSLCVFSGERLTTAYRPLTVWVVIIHGVDILLYSRQKYCFSLPCLVTPTLHQDNWGLLLTPGGIKNSFSSDAATILPPAASQFITKEKNPKRIKCCQLPAQIGHKVHGKHAK